MAVTIKGKMIDIEFDHVDTGSNACSFFWDSFLTEEIDQ